ncbi:nitrite reductase small subunit NirD [Brachybacterium sp.]|uniref:nitrite reductase small subunit NirD n=1 Tax=Brachybacterium sp. TaxID=1891286 RepID=UPI002ED0F391
MSSTITSTPTSSPSGTSTRTLSSTLPATATHRFAARRTGAPALAPGLAANWIRLCPLSALEVERGRAALVGEEQVALFLLADGDVRAVDNHDPYSGANVISRGIVGSRGNRPTIASPMHKQVFDLRSGVSVETRGKEVRRLRVWPVRTLDGELYVLRGGAR